LAGADYVVVSKYAVEHELSKRCHLPSTPAEHTKNTSKPYPSRTLKKKNNF
jgi:hypothetical protein